MEQTKHPIWEKLYPGKAILKLLYIGSEPDLRWEDRYIYSWLVKCQTVSDLALWQLSGLCNGSTQASLCNLERLGLCKGVNGAYQPLRPPKEEKHYLSYFGMLIPKTSCPLSLKQTAVYCALHGMRPQTLLHLSRYLRIKHSIISDAVEQLRRLDMIDCNLIPCPLTPERHDWFKSKSEMEVYK